MGHVYRPKSWTDRCAVGERKFNCTAGSRKRCGYCSSTYDFILQAGVDSYYLKEAEEEEGGKYIVLWISCDTCEGGFLEAA
jgi:hypothetical protein